MTFAIDVSCGREEVFSWISDPESAIQWQKGIKDWEILIETPQKTGTTFKEELEENGKHLTMYGEIMDFVPDKLISFHLESKIHIVNVKYSVAGDHHKSTVHLDIAIAWKFPMNVISLFAGQSIRQKMRQQMESEMSELKKLCEKRS